MAHEVGIVNIDGKIGVDGFDAREDTRSRLMNASRSFGYYGSGFKALPRSRIFRPERRNVRMVGLILAIMAAIVVVSAIGVAPVSKAMASAPVLTEATARQPEFPYLVYGYTYASDGMTLLPNCDIVFTNLRTGEFVTNVSTDPEAFYMCDITFEFPSGWEEADTINITATFGATLIGWTETVIDSIANPGYVQADVTLHDVSGIPEFSMVIMPVVGVIALFAFVSLRRKS